MPQDIFDRVAPPDIFDRVASPEVTGDIFDRIGGDIFDRVSIPPSLDKPDFILGGEIPPGPTQEDADREIVLQGQESIIQESTKRVEDRDRGFFEKNLDVGQSKEEKFGTNAKAFFELLTGHPFKAAATKFIPAFEEQSKSLDLVTGGRPLRTLISGEPDVNTVAPGVERTAMDTVRDVGTEILTDPTAIAGLVKGGAKGLLALGRRVARDVKDAVSGISGGAARRATGGPTPTTGFTDGRIQPVTPSPQDAGPLTGIKPGAVDRVGLDVAKPEFGGDIGSRLSKNAPVDDVKFGKEFPVTQVDEFSKVADEIVDPANRLVRDPEGDLVGDVLGREGVASGGHKTLKGTELLKERASLTPTKRKSVEFTTNKGGKRVRNRVYPDAADDVIDVPVDDALPLLHDTVPFSVARQAGKEAVDFSKRAGVQISQQIRRADLSLMDNGAEAVVTPLTKARGPSLEFYQKYGDIREEIIKNVKPDSPLSEGISLLLDKRMSVAELGGRSGNAVALEAHRISELLRNRYFDPIFDLIDESGSLKQIVGDIGYTEGYFPLVIKQAKASGLSPAQLDAMFKNLGVSDFAPSIVRPRTGNIRQLGIEGVELDITKVLPRYERAAGKSIYELPAYDEAQKAVLALDDGATKEFAQWYIDNFIGHPKLKPTTIKGKVWEEFSHRISNIFYDAFIGANPMSAALNSTQTFVNTIPELGHFTAKGWAQMLTKEGRDILHKSGIMNDLPGMERVVSKQGLYSKIMYGMFQTVEYWNRGIAYLGGLKKAASQGLTGQAQKDFALEIVGKTQFFYDHASPIAARSTLGPAVTQFWSYPIRQAEFITGILKEARRGDPGGKAKAARMVGMWVVMSSGAAGTGIGIDSALNFMTDFIPPVANLVSFPGYVKDVLEGDIDATDVPEDILDAMIEFIPAQRGLRKFKEAADFVLQ